ncbi:MAG TPA: M12 family metallo-peptidase [Steroidobacteraceae bacterium]|jgi:metallopeptidase family M12-like protein|nr:M12 family metallo-peptidase [Steroidobacteraceae bacterium]
MSTLTREELAGRMWRSVLFATLCIASSCVLGQTSEGGPLWQTERTRETPPRTDQVVSAQVVRVDAALLKSAANSRFTLVMPDGARLVIVKTGEERVSNGGFVWRGRIEREPRSNVTLSVVKDVVIGTFSTSRGVYRLRYWKDDLHLIERVDLSRYPRELEPRAPSAEPQRLQGQACTTDDGKVIDLLVVYTDDAEGAASGATAMLAHVNAAVSDANLSYANSNLQQRLRLVHLAKLDYDESVGVDAALIGFESATNSVFAPVRAWRDQYRADVVALITASGPCGRSNIMKAVGPAFAASAISVVQLNCGTDEYSFGHELGHLMSARHDWFSDGEDNSPYAYNHACTQPHPLNGEDPWRTMMAMDDECQIARDPENHLPIHCQRLLQWSDPNGCRKKDATGVVKPSAKTDNRLTLENTARTVANFRCALPTQPNPPSGIDVN